MIEFYYEGEIETNVQGEEATIGGVLSSMLPATDVNNLEDRNLGNFFPKQTLIFNDYDLEDPMEGNSAIIKEPDVGIDKLIDYCYDDVTIDKETISGSNGNKAHNEGTNNFPKLVRWKRLAREPMLSTELRANTDRKRKIGLSDVVLEDAFISNSHSFCSRSIDMCPRRSPWITAWVGKS